MYPQGELTALAQRKIALRFRIHARRQSVAAQAALAARPVQWVDTVRAQWRQLSPYTKAAAVPLAYVLKRTLGGRSRLLGWTLRWAPLAYTLFKYSRSNRK